MDRILTHLRAWGEAFTRAKVSAWARAPPGLLRAPAYGLSRAAAAPEFPGSSRPECGAWWPLPDAKRRGWGRSAGRRLAVNHVACGAAQSIGQRPAQADGRVRQGAHEEDVEVGAVERAKPLEQPRRRAHGVGPGTDDLDDDGAGAGEWRGQLSYT